MHITHIPAFQIENSFCETTQKNLIKSSCSCLLNPLGQQLGFFTWGVTAYYHSGLPLGRHSPKPKALGSRDSEIFSSIGNLYKTVNWISDTQRKKFGMCEVKKKGQSNCILPLGMENGNWRDRKWDQVLSLLNWLQRIFPASGPKHVLNTYIGQYYCASLVSRLRVNHATSLIFLTTLLTDWTCFCNGQAAPFRQSSMDKH